MSVFGCFLNRLFGKPFTGDTPHECRFVPIKRGYPIFVCKCGAMKQGKNTITTRPGGTVDLIRWSASQAAVQLGDLAMSITTGRPSAFINAQSRSLMAFAEGAGPRRQWSIYQEVGQATFDQLGIRASAFVAEGTNTRVTTTDGEYVNYNTGGAANNDAGGRATAGNYTHTERQFNPIFSATVRTGATITDIRNWVGLFENDPMASATPALHYMAFRYDTGADGTAFWRAVTDNASGTPTVTATTVAYAASTSYLLQIVSDTAGGNVFFFIDGVLVATHTTTLPTSTQDLGFVSQLRNLVAAARDFMISNIHCSQRPSANI